MPKAGFWAIDATRRISFGRDGWWYANDERIQHQRINLLFSQHLHKTTDGTYEIVIGRDRVAVDIDDTPYVVTRVTENPEHELLIHLNDGSTEFLDPTTLIIGQDNVLYCCVKGGQHAARFLRPAYYQLAAHIEENSTTGTFFLQLGRKTYPIMSTQL